MEEREVVVRRFVTLRNEREFHYAAVILIMIDSLRWILKEVYWVSFDAP